MGQGEMPWQSGPFMIAGHDINRDAPGGELKEGLICPVNNMGRYLAPEEKIPTVDNQVHLLSAGKIQNKLVVGKEILTTPAPLDPGPDGQVEA
jgi:hypothetical protein